MKDKKNFKIKKNVRKAVLNGYIHVAGRVVQPDQYILPEGALQRWPAVTSQPFSLITVAGALRESKIGDEIK